MDYSLLVGIHRCSDSAQATDEASSGDKPMADLPDTSAGVLAIKCSTGAYQFFASFVSLLSI